VAKNALTHDVATHFSTIKESGGRNEGINKTDLHKKNQQAKNNQSTNKRRKIKRTTNQSTNQQKQANQPANYTPINKSISFQFPKELLLLLVSYSTLACIST
jgi:hypothetical protein